MFSSIVVQDVYKANSNIVNKFRVIKSVIFFCDHSILADRNTV